MFGALLQRFPRSLAGHPCPSPFGLALLRSGRRRGVSDSSYRGFPISIFIRRRADMWEVSTTIHAPEALAHELGDHVTMEVMQLPTNRIERVRSDALDQAKKTIDGIVRDGAAAAELTRSEST